jgi:hypothetical protein
MPTTTVDVPTLLIVFNRPDNVRRVVAALRDVKPCLLFVAGDGPRPDVPGDAARCTQVRAALAEIDWECSLRVQFQESNLGCKQGPEVAITWFLSHVGKGIVLEDDCIPTADFFPFCAELLDRYESDERVMMIGGHNPISDRCGRETGYVFSRSSPTWGWATWQRAWQHYDPELRDWGSPAARRTIRSWIPASEFRMARRRFDLVRAGRLDAWDFAWIFTMLRRNALSVVPTSNLIDNIGFGPDATHTRNPSAPDAGIPVEPLEFPLRHPEAIRPSEEFDRALLSHRFPLQRRILTLLPIGVADRLRNVAYRLVPGMRGQKGDVERVRPRRRAPEVAGGDRPAPRG